MRGVTAERLPDVNVKSLKIDELKRIIRPTSEFIASVITNTAKAKWQISLLIPIPENSLQSPLWQLKADFV